MATSQAKGRKQVSNPKFTMSRDDKMRADVGVKFRLDRDAIAAILNNGLRSGFCDGMDDPTKGQIWTIVRNILRECGSNALLDSGDEDPWVTQQVKKLIAE